MPRPSPAQAVAVPEPELSPLQQLLAEKSLPAAIARMRPQFQDSVNDLDPAAIQFALWSAGHLTWDGLQVIPETKHALVLKDPAAERGKRNCYTGMISEIKVDRTAGPVLHIGSVATGAGNFVRFLAVRSTGQLVQNSQATFCGIVTGLYSFSNTIGGMTNAVFAVGMFDLPENRSLK